MIKPAAIAAANATRIGTSCDNLKFTNDLDTKGFRGSALDVTLSGGCPW